MTPSIRLLVSDIDGTLITPDEVITEDFSKLTNLLAQKQVGLVLASGRCLSETQKFIDALNCVDGVVINNGAGGRMGREALWDEYFPAYTLKDVIRKADSMGMTILMSTGDDILGYKMTPYIADEIRTFERFNHFYIPLEREWQTFQFERVSVIDQKYPGEIDELLPLMTPYADEIEICRHSARHLEIVKKGVHKGKGVLRMIEKMGISAENVLAIGDGANDVELLELAGIGVTPSNGAERARRAAKAVMDHPGIKGVIEAVDRFC